MKIETKLNVGDYIWMVNEEDLSLSAVKIISIKIEQEAYYIADNTYEDEIVIAESDIDKPGGMELCMYYFSNAQPALDYLKSLLEEQKK